MRTLLIMGLVAATANAQQTAPLQLWTDAHRQGHVQQVRTTTVEQEELRFELVGRVSSLQVGQGYTVTLHTGTGTLPQTIVLVGPLVVNDLKSLPMLGLRPNWDDAVAAVEVRPSVEEQDVPVPPVLAEVR
ncbi:MAG: hypothetical protein IT228_06785 [Flavobacteriales bacterium]|nr:hypothetical protein [Flavobacteriales bacterium]NUQ15594.1 hypothetical protein [Flavobacteriales bacterium]